MDAGLHMEGRYAVDVAVAVDVSVSVGALAFGHSSTGAQQDLSARNGRGQFRALGEIRAKSATAVEAAKQRSDSQRR